MRTDIMQRLVTKKVFAILAGLVIGSMTSSVALAAGSKVALDKAHMNMSDKASLQNGAKLFVNYCLACHGASYARYNRVAADLEIPLDLLKENLMFTTDKTGDPMTASMSPDDAKEWFGVIPPDLSLVSRVRKPDWVYTYLRGFYPDENSATGWNNSLYENVAMPHVMHDLQGVQQFVGKVEKSDHGSGAAHASEGNAGVADGNYKIVGDSKFEIISEGTLSPLEFDKAMADLTAFLTYLAEPAQLKRKSMGIYSIAFLIILTILSYLLKKEYWRDVH